MVLRWWISVLVIMNAMNSNLAKPKGTMKTIETEYGEVAHCVDIYQQPAFTNPLLHNHSIQMKPTTILQGINLDEESSTKTQVQTWSCPKGTVPIRSSTFSVTVDSNHDIHKFAVIDHRHAHSDIFGVSTTMNTWSLGVENDDLSMAKVWIKNDLEEPTETIEAGWMINPHHTESPNEPIVFVFFTNDAHPEGCYNLDCHVFVLTNEKFGLGSKVLASSIRDGEQQEINIAIMKDMKTGNWWFYFEYDPVGYWPHEFFPRMGPCDSIKEADIRNAGGNVAQWGGEVVESVNSDHPTWTQMGSGSFAQEGDKRAAYMRQVFYYDINRDPKVPNPVSYVEDHPDCYNVAPLKDDHDDSRGIFYFGGPGRESKNCTN